VFNVLFFKCLEKKEQITKAMKCFFCNRHIDFTYAFISKCKACKEVYCPDHRGYDWHACKYLGEIQAECKEKNAKKLLGEKTTDTHGIQRI
jgi:predicted nucleic acid binding AN1-type Zn finger protein